LKADRNLLSAISESLSGCLDDDCHTGMKAN
jgi:hypothetical protein